MISKKLNFLSIFLSTIFLFACFSIEAGQLYTDEYAWDKEDVYRPNPILFLHGFAKGSAESWSNAISVLNKHYGKYYKDSYPNSHMGLSFGNSREYLETIEFFYWRHSSDQRLIDKNGSIDTYRLGDYYVDQGSKKANDPGWRDMLYYWMREQVPPGVIDRGHMWYLLNDCSRKENTKVDPIFDRYNSNVNFICHSMGGLAARSYLQVAGNYKVDKLITVGTAHKGTIAANIGNNIANANKIGWNNINKLSILFTAISGMIDKACETIAQVDGDGDAVRDQRTDSSFIRDLNADVTSGVKYYTIYGEVAGIKGDLIVPSSSQRGDNVLSLAAPSKRISASHSEETSEVAKWDGLVLLGCLDDEKPEISLTKLIRKKKTDDLEKDWDVIEIGATTEPINLDLNRYKYAYIEGSVDKVHLPATSEVEIVVFKEPNLTEAVWCNLSEQDRFLLPYENKEPAPAGFRAKIKFRQDDLAPETGIYHINISVINPAGLYSKTETLKVRIPPVIHPSLCIFVMGGLNYWDGELGVVSSSSGYGIIIEKTILQDSGNYRLEQLARGYAKFDLSDIPSDIHRATLYANFYGMHTEWQDYSIGIYNVLGSIPDEPSLRWWSQPEVSSSPVSICSDASLTWDITSLISNWKSNPATNHGLCVRYVNESCIQKNTRRYLSIWLIIE